MRLHLPARVRTIALAATLALLASPAVATTAAAGVAAGTPAAVSSSSPTSVGSAPLNAAIKSAKPTIGGKARVGTRLTAKPGSWTAGTTFTYSWKVAGKQVATGKHFTPKKSHVGKKVRVTVTGKKPGQKAVTRTSDAKKITKGVFSAPVPKITGKAAVGATLTANAGTWKPAPTTVRYQWRADGKAIPGATSRTFKVTTAQLGTKITVRVTAQRGGYADRSRVSAATSKVVRATPSRTSPTGEYTCPSWAPVKGNQTTRHTKDWIYHVPGGRYYDATKPEECFASASAAEKAGYRASQNG